jgi:aryl-alcohol dehydrogenase-like predicted oxidoreductase
LFERAIEADILPYAKEHGLAVLAYGPLCRGLLAGGMTSVTKFPGNDLRSGDPKFQMPRFRQYLAAVQALEAYARDRYGKSVLALAIRWVLDQGPTIALWGARKPAQIAGIDEAMGWSLLAEDKSEINRILDQTITDPVGPEFMAPPAG